MVYTSYYNASSRLPSNIIKVGISLVPPKDNPPQFVMSWFYPTPEILSKYNKDKNVELYTKAYTEQILNKLNINDVKLMLTNPKGFNGMDICLLCYEPPEKFCHRHLVAEWLNANGIHCEEYDYNDKGTINYFRGKYSFLSNMYECPVKCRGMLFKSSESAYQSFKSITPKEFIPLNGYEAKKLAKYCKLDSDFHNRKFDIMKYVVRCKFNQNPELADMLIDTHSCEIIEGNDWGDTYWGVCNGVGLNMLGKILMMVRAELIAGIVSVEE